MGNRSADKKKRAVLIIIIIVNDIVHPRFCHTRHTLKQYSICECHRLSLVWLLELESHRWLVPDAAAAASAVARPACPDERWRLRFKQKVPDPTSYNLCLGVAVYTSMKERRISCTI